MILKSLEISGFKSFARKTTLEFNSSISAIVGPNGSGKSNVAEAFRFVLGEQSLKSLRGKKGEDMIFNGGKTMGRLNRASVKLIFDNRSKLFPIDFDEIVIERVVHRDGVNEYLMNGSQVRLKDITELLFSAHIGSSGHHIISQGEADRILASSVKERRAMLEETLGLKVYQIKKEEGERKLLKTSENIASVESLRREIAPHLKFLKKQVERYEKALALKEELTSLYLLYFKIEDDFVSKEKERIHAARTIPEEHLRSIREETQAVKQQLNRGDEHTKESDNIIALREKTSDIRFKKETLVREAGKIEAEISFISREIRRLEGQAHENDNKTILLSELRNLEKTIDDYSREADSLNDVESLKRLVATIKHSCSSFIETHASSSKGLEEEKQKHIHEQDAKHKERERIEGQIVELNEIEKDLRQEEEQLKADIDKKKDDTFEAEKKMLELMSKEQEVENELSSLRFEEERTRALEEEMKRDLHEAGMLMGTSILRFKEHLPDQFDNYLNEGRAAQVDRRRDVERKKIRYEEAGAGNSDEVMREFKEVSERDEFLERELLDLHHSSESLQTLIKDLELKIDTEFREGIVKINTEFNNFFVLMFGGGHASLKLIREEKRKDNSFDEDENQGIDSYESELIPEEEKETKEGIEIDVGLPHKKTKGLVMLSGGERALASIALLFAISQVNPPPFIILDETDAALDEANSKKYGDMVERLAAHSGLILITHNRETMSRAGVIYGVTMGSEGFSKLLSIQFDEAVAVAK